MTTPCFDSMGNITLDGFLIQNIALLTFKAPMHLLAIFLCPCNNIPRK